MKKQLVKLGRIKNAFIALHIFVLCTMAFTAPALAEAKEDLSHTGSVATTGRIEGDAPIHQVTADFMSFVNPVALSQGASNLDGVDWNDDGTTCTLVGTVTGGDLWVEIEAHKDSITTFIANPGSVIQNTLAHVFSHCRALTSVDLSQCTLQSINSMASMFEECELLQTVTFPSSFDGSNISDMSKLFYNCHGLRNIVFPTSFATPNVSTMSGMFYGCTTLSDFSFLGSLNTSAVLDMSEMFRYCSSAQSIAFPNSFDVGAVNNLDFFLSDCSNLESVTFTGLFNTENAESMNFMFNECTSLKQLELPESFNTVSVRNMHSMFKGCVSLKKLELPKAFDTTNVDEMPQMFFGCQNLETLVLPDAFNCENATSVYSFLDSCKALNNFIFPATFNPKNVTSFDSFFSGCESLVTIEFPELCTITEADDLSYMFSNCKKLETVKFPSSFKTNKIDTTAFMFKGCSSLVKLDLSNLSLKSIQICWGMFTYCDSLEELNLGSFTTQAPEGYEAWLMFANLNSDTYKLEGSVSSITTITMDSSLLLTPGEGEDMDTASGSFFDYKEPESWNAYYLGNEKSDLSAISSVQAKPVQTEANNLPTATLVGFDEFKAYQETHPGLTTYVLGSAPVPPEPTPQPAPDSTPDSFSVSDGNSVPNTGDTKSWIMYVSLVIVGSILLCAAHARRKYSMDNQEKAN